MFIVDDIMKEFIANRMRDEDSPRPFPNQEAPIERSLILWIFKNITSISFYFLDAKGMRSGEVPTGGRGQFPPNSSDHQPPRLTKSRTSLELNNNSNRVATKIVVAPQQTVAPSASATVIGSITIQQQPVSKETSSQFVLQRSKSSGSHLSLQQQKVPVPITTVKVNNPELPDVSQFPDAAQVLLRKIAVGTCTLSQ